MHTHMYIYIYVHMDFGGNPKDSCQLDQGLAFTMYRPSSYNMEVDCSSLFFGQTYKDNSSRSTCNLEGDFLSSKLRRT